MGYLVLRFFRFRPPDEEEILNPILNKKRLDPDFSVQANKKHTAERVVYEFDSTYGPPDKVEGQQLPSADSKNHVAENIRQEVEYELVTFHNMTCNIEIMLQKIYVPVHRKNCSYYQVMIWLLILEIMLQKKLKKKFPEVEYQLPSHYHDLASDSRNHVAENTLPKEESKLLPSHNLALHNRNHVAENTFPMVEYLQLPSHHLISYFRDQVAEQTFSGVRKKDCYVNNFKCHFVHVEYL